MAIRRLHRQFNHPAPRTLQAILGAGGAAKEFIEASKLVKCESCERTSPKPRSQPVGIGEGNYVFGDVVGVDVLETMDSNRRRYQCFNIVDLATGFQQLELLREVTKENQGPPPAEMCLEAFQRWIAWAGLPRCMTMNMSGFSPSQWVLGRNPREPGTLTDEDTWNDIEGSSTGPMHLSSDRRVGLKPRKLWSNLIQVEEYRKR